jgi:hypothetical protein
MIEGAAQSAPFLFSRLRAEIDADDFWGHAQPDWNEAGA